MSPAQKAAETRRRNRAAADQAAPAARIGHYFEPARMTKRSIGNVAGCCNRPEAEHPAWVEGSILTVQLRRDVRTLRGTIVPRGTALVAERESLSAIAEVRPSRWGTNTLGQFAELDRGEYATVRTPSYRVRFAGDEHYTALPLRWVAEVTR